MKISLITKKCLFLCEPGAFSAISAVNTPSKSPEYYFTLASLVFRERKRALYYATQTLAPISGFTLIPESSEIRGRV